MLLNYFITGIGCIITLCVLILMVIQNYVIDSKLRKNFIITIILTIIIIVCELGTSYFEQTSVTFNWLYIIFNVIGFSVSPLIPAFLSAAYFNGKKNMKYIVLPLTANIVFSVLSPSFGYIFDITLPNSYERGPLFIIFVITYMASTFYLLVCTIQMIRYHQSDGVHTLLLIFSFVITAVNLQIFIPTVHLTWLCISFAQVLLYAFYCELSEKEDSLTHLFNRRAYEHHLHKLSKKNEAIILFFDIDKFKDINDNYGHLFGDTCLKKVSQMIKDEFSIIGRCYRIGGDEFCVLVTSYDEETVKECIKDFINKVMTSKAKYSNLPTVSVGYSVYKKEDGDITKAISNAELEMYYYKEKRSSK